MYIILSSPIEILPEPQVHDLHTERGTLLCAHIDWNGYQLYNILKRIQTRIKKYWAKHKEVMAL